MDVGLLFDRQNKRIYRIAMLYLNNEADAEDAVEEILLKCIQKQISFVDESHENAWFITTTKNYCKDKLRSFWHKKVDLGEIPEIEAERSEERVLLEHIMRLPVKYREVLCLYYYEEYAVKEMSELLHRKESTIQTQLATARKRLKIILEKEGNYYGRKENESCI